MNAEQLQPVSDCLGALAERLGALPEHRAQAVHAALACVMARTVVAELAAHLKAGVDPYDALCRSAVGEMPMPPAAAQLYRRLIAERSQMVAR